MHIIIENVMKHKKVILTFFMVLFIGSLISMKYVKVNYNMLDYLPKESKSTVALSIMDQEFSSSITNARVMIKNVSITEALAYKAQIKAVEGVQEITFLDDEISSKIPLEMMDSTIRETWYKDNNAIFNLVINQDTQNETVDKIKEIIDDHGVMAGTTVNSVAAEQATSEELIMIFAFVIPIVLIILLLTTSSWFEPFLFLITIGIAIVMNMGTNIIFGELSFVTKAAAAILQLAVSMDYSIFLLHCFADYRKQNLPVEEAMKKAVVSAFPSILSSGLTTVVGFAALILMKFRIGPDMGLVMTKAIICSLLCVLILLPILAVYSYKLIDKTNHRSFVPDFTKLGKGTARFRKPICILFLLIIIPCLLGSTHNQFTYGGSKVLSEETQAMKDEASVEEVFGKSNQMVIMVPKGDFSKEKQLADQLLQNENITSVVSYVTKVGVEIPPEYVPKEIRSLLLSEHYSRFLITVNLPEESPETFTFIDDLQKTIDQYYHQYHLAGSSVSAYDLKDVVTKDNMVVNIVAVIAIAIILIVTFKSISLPIVLLVVIETSIWLNLTYVYFTSGELSYIAYLIISSIQLGATIDYAILFTDHYIKNRKTMSARHASEKTIAETFISIFTSASILTICGFMLGYKSSNLVISQLGFLIGRGAFISTILVIFVLPGLLIIADKIIEKTTYHKKKGDVMKKKIISMCLILLLCYTNMPVLALEKNKEENIYVNMDNNGSVKGVYVVNGFIIEEEQQLCDFGNYQEVRNLTSSNAITMDQGKNCVSVSPGNFYYQGNIENPNLPWSVTIRYELDGKEVTSEDLAGAYGHLKIYVSLQQNEQGSKEFFDNYLVQITFTYHNENIQNIQANGGMISNVGDSKQVMYNVLVGNEKEIVVEGDIHDFTMEPITLNGVLMSMDIDLNQITPFLSDIDTLENAVSKLYRGNEKVDDSTSQMLLALEKLKTGANTIQQNFQLLQQKGNLLTTGSSQFLDNFKTLDKNIQTLYLLNHQETTTQLLEYVKGAYSSDPYIMQVLTLLEKHMDMVNILYQANLSNNFENFQEQLNLYVESINQLGKGYQEIYTGLNELYQALLQLQNGTNELKNGSKNLYDEIAPLKKEINTTISSLTNYFNHGEYQPISFVSKENQNVSSVQFAMKTEGIQKKEQTITNNEENIKKSFWQKLIDLFH